VGRLSIGDPIGRRLLSAAVLDGVYELNDLKAAQDERILLFFEHGIEQSNRGVALGLARQPPRRGRAAGAQRRGPRALTRRLDERG
jgi:hypothetical protein